ncbi:hypothetical protein [Devosia aurantiaca]|uniref:Uncharacterized protein n=1 Tax=Devosia aurantiaca TaxID=2714858 RepID=A0A6M1SRP3_9HYPH|nr:hypothetical protein [Devosia aurantiaca]NGP19314.1 hypothetical protein [Devosia aurantiaca]
MNFTIRPDLAVQFGWGAGDKLEVMVGEGEHHGLVRYRKNNSVGSVDVVKRAGVHDSHYFTLTLGHLSAYVDRSEPKRWINAEVVEDGWVEFVLPSWADETAPRKTGQAPAQTVPASRAIAEAANFKRPTRSVTAGMMGDPPAGRSALAEKQGA